LMREAVVQFGSRVTLEASGGISLETVAAVAATGVHIVSVGSITYQVQGLAMHLEIG